jgi:hypothetical protein
MFGKPVECRTLHSVRTLSAETGLHPKRLRKLLGVAGALPTDADGLADGNCLFDAEKGSLAAREAAAASLSVASPVNTSTRPGCSGTCSTGPG